MGSGNEDAAVKKKATLYDVAAAAGLSPATVSRTLNHPGQVDARTRERVLEACSACGFEKRRYRRAADRDASARSGDGALSSADTAASSGAPALRARMGNGIFLLLVPGALNPFYGDVIEGIISAATPHGFRVLTDYYQLTERNVDEYIEMFLAQGFSGLIMMGTTPTAVLERLTGVIPVIQCSEYDETYDGISSVCIDDRAAMRRAVEYAISLGRRKPAFFCSPLQMHYSSLRLRGFSDAVRAAGIAVPPQWIVQIPQISYSMGYDAASKLLARGNAEKPDVILTVSDVFASACINAAAAAGIAVPGQLAVIGFDNISLAQSTVPPVTTVNQPRFQLGYTAFETLHREITEPGTRKQRIFLPAGLIIRGSTP